MFIRFTHLTSPKKIIGLKNCRFSETTEDQRDANDTLIKCLKFLLARPVGRNTIPFVFHE